MLHTRTISASLLGSVLLTALFSAGCTTNYELNTTPISKWQDHQRVPANVNLVLSDKLRDYVFDKGNFEGDHFKYPIGKVVAVNAQAMAEAAFAHVSVTNGTAAAPPGINGILTAEMGLVDRSTSAWAFDPVDMTVDVKWTASDAQGHVVWVKTIRGTAKYHLGNAYNHRAHAREHVDLVMIDLFNKSLMAITTSPQIRGLAARPPSP